MLRRIHRGVVALLFPARADDAADREIRHFVELRARELARDQLSDAEAVRRATLEIGNVTVTREVVRASGWEHGLDLLLSDIRFALRRLRREPVFTLVVTVTLALGIGTATTIISAVYPILFRPLPYPSGDRLVAIQDRTPSGAASQPTYARTRSCSPEAAPSSR